MKSRDVLIALVFLLIFIVGVPMLFGTVSPPSDGDIYTYVDEVTRYWWNQGVQIWEHWSEQFQAWVSAG